MTSGKCRYRGNLPESLSGECIKTAPKSRAGFEHENAAKLAFLGLKKATISWLQAPRNAADLRACARSKDVGFSCRTVLRHDTRGQNPIPGEPVYLLKGRRGGVHRPCLFPAWITHLSTPQGCGQPCGFVSYPRSKLTPSAWKTLRVFHPPVALACGAFFKFSNPNSRKPLRLFSLGSR